MLKEIHNQLSEIKELHEAQVRKAHLYIESITNVLYPVQDTFPEELDIIISINGKSFQVEDDDNAVFEEFISNYLVRLIELTDSHENTVLIKMEKINKLIKLIKSGNHGR